MYGCLPVYVCVSVFCLGLPWQVKFLGNAAQQQPQLGEAKMREAASLTATRLALQLCVRLSVSVCKCGCVCKRCVLYMVVYICTVLDFTLVSEKFCYLHEFLGFSIPSFHPPSLSLSRSLSHSSKIYDTAHRILHICTGQINFACDICALR